MINQAIRSRERPATKPVRHRHAPPPSPCVRCRALVVDRAVSRAIVRRSSPRCRSLDVDLWMRNDLGLHRAVWYV
jgi:hypothetical protein